MADPTVLGKWPEYLEVKVEVADIEEEQGFADPLLVKIENDSEEQEVTHVKEEFPDDVKVKQEVPGVEEEIEIAVGLAAGTQQSKPGGSGGIFGNLIHEKGEIILEGEEMAIGESCGTRHERSDGGSCAQNSKEDLRGEELNVCDVPNFGSQRPSGNISDNVSTVTGDLENHMIVSSYSCDICEYKSSIYANVKRHTRTHSGEKPYSCSNCNHKCTQAAHLKVHMRTHTGEKPYSCNICDYKCAEAGRLKRHMKAHTGEKPHFCNICDYNCKEADQLKAHVRTHSGEKPYSCNLCGYKFSKAGNLKRHIMRTLERGSMHAMCPIRSQLPPRNTSDYESSLTGD